MLIVHKLYKDLCNKYVWYANIFHPEILRHCLIHVDILLLPWIRIGHKVLSLYSEMNINQFILFHTPYWQFTFSSRPFLMIIWWMLLLKTGRPKLFKFDHHALLGWCQTHFPMKYIPLSPPLSFSWERFFCVSFLAPDVMKTQYFTFWKNRDRNFVEI